MGTPIDQRYLWFDGVVSTKIRKLVKGGLPDQLFPDTEILFVGYAYDDIPFTKRFDVLFPKGRPQDGIRCQCQIIAATQQFGKPFFEIPHGWKTICVVHFEGGIPALIRQLPILDSWGHQQNAILMCDEATWEYLRLV